MKVDNLSVGMIVKNYPELCRLLEVDEKTGNSKIGQIKEFERYFSYSKEGNKFIINELYATPKDKIENNRNTAEFTPYLELLLMQLLLSRNDKHLTITTTDLAQQLSMVNRDFKEYYSDRIKLSEMLYISIERINEFFNNTKSSYKSSITTAIGRLKRKQAIIYEYRLMVKRAIVNSEGLTIDYSYKFATEKEKENVLAIRYIVLESMGGDMKKLFANPKSLVSYYKMVDKQLGAQHGILRAYEVHLITMNDYAIKKEYLKQLESMTGEEINLLRDSVKDLFSNRNIKNAERRKETANQLSNKCGSVNISKTNRNRISFNYIEDYQKLNRAFITESVSKVYHDDK